MAPPPGGSRPSVASLRWAAALGGLALAVASAFWPLYERMTRASVDFRAHLDFARGMARAGRAHSERFGFELLTLVAAGFSDDRADLARAAVVVATLATVAKAVLSARWLKREYGPAAAVLLALVVLFVAPITFMARHPLMPLHSAVHLGQMSGLIVHNPTTVVVFPLAVALFAASWRRRAGWTSALAAVQCFVKPNFVVAWMPVFVVLELWRDRRDGRGWWVAASRTAGIVAPAVAVLAWQLATSEKLGTAMVIAPFRAWRGLSPDIPLSIARSLAFPALLAVVHFRELRRRPELGFAWTIFGVALAQYSLLYLRGAAYPGNWSWGRYLAIYVVFLLSVAAYARIAARRESWRGWRAVANGALAALLALHLYSGLFYYWQGVRDGLW